VNAARPLSPVPRQRTIAWGRNIPADRWLAVILIFQCGFSVLALRNSVSQDEALYLTAGKQIVNHIFGGMASESYAPRLSGLPYLYPPIAGVLDLVGGLELARGFSLLCMLCTTIVVFLMGRSLYDERSGVAAAAIYSIQASTLLIGRLATYDAACLLLLALAAIVALHADSVRTPVLVALVSALLVLAIATKYVGELFAPTIVAIMATETWRVHGWRTALLRATLILCAIGGLLCIGMVLLTRADSTGVRLAATTRFVENPLPRMELLRRTLLLAVALSSLAVIGLSFSKRRALASILLASVAAAPAFHLWKAEPVSLQKHIGYGLFFAAPLAGYGIMRLAAGTRLQRCAAIAIALVAIGLGLEQAHQYYRDWPNDRALIAVLRTRIRPTSRILADDSDIVRYEFKDWRADARRRYTDLNDFEYVDAAGQHHTGNDAYRAAIAAQYFDLIILSDGPNRATDVAVDDALRDSGRYDLVARIPYTTRSNSGTYRIWRKRL
jgi:hypothetical protein